MQLFDKQPFESGLRDVYLQHTEIAAGIAIAFWLFALVDSYLI